MRKKSTCFILQFETICLVIRHKNTCGDKLILVKVASWSTALINVIFQSNQSLSRYDNCTVKELISIFMFPVKSITKFLKIKKKPYF